jgi:hypothetical protein
MQFLPAIPLLWAAGAAGVTFLGGTFLGWQAGTPEVDAQGNPIAGPVESAGKAVGTGIGTAITAVAVIGAAYLIYKNELK